MPLLKRSVSTDFQCWSQDRLDALRRHYTPASTCSLLLPAVRHQATGVERAAPSNTGHEDIDEEAGREQGNWGGRLLGREKGGWRKKRRRNEDKDRANASGEVLIIVVVGDGGQFSGVADSGAMDRYSPINMRAAAILALTPQSVILTLIVVRAAMVLQECAIGKLEAACMAGPSFSCCCCCWCWCS
jgi:hypothetical protein